MKQKKSFGRGDNEGQRLAYRATLSDITEAQQSPPNSDDREKILRDLNQKMDDAFDEIAAEELTPGDAPHLFALLGQITESVQRIDKENPTGPDEETDLRIVALLRMANRITGLLDPLVRENFKDNPEKLAKWEEIMQDYNAAQDEPGGED